MVQGPTFRASTLKLTFIDSNSDYCDDRLAVSSCTTWIDRGDICDMEGMKRGFTGINVSVSGVQKGRERVSQSQSRDLICFNNPCHLLTTQIVSTVSIEHSLVPDAGC